MACFRRSSENIGKSGISELAFLGGSSEKRRKTSGKHREIIGKNREKRKNHAETHRRKIAMLTPNGVFSSEAFLISSTRKKWELYSRTPCTRVAPAPRGARTGTPAGSSTSARTLRTSSTACRRPAGRR